MIKKTVSEVTIVDIFIIRNDFNMFFAFGGINIKSGMHTDLHSIHDGVYVYTSKNTKNVEVNS